MRIVLLVSFFFLSVAGARAQRPTGKVIGEKVRDGAHTWTYWRTGIIGGLAFIGQRFHQ